MLDLDTLKELCEAVSKAEGEVIKRYYDLGETVTVFTAVNNVSIREIARQLNRKGFGHVTLSLAVQFFGLVQSEYHGDVEKFLERTRQRFDTTKVSWRLVILLLEREPRYGGRKSKVVRSEEIARTAQSRDYDVGTNLVFYDDSPVPVLYTYLYSKRPTKMPHPGPTKKGIAAPLEHHSKVSKALKKLGYVDE